MERQTDLTLDEMMKELRTQSCQESGCQKRHNGSGLPQCLLANEVGVMAHNGNREAEAFLCELMLCHDSENLRAISYSYLKSLPRKQTGTVEAIKVFVTDPQNAAVIRAVEEREEEEQEELRRLAEEKLPGNS